MSANKIVFFGELPQKHKVPEWFPFFNKFLRDNYLAKDFDIERAKCINSRAPQKIYQYEDHKAQINANNLILFNPSNNRSVAFSTFYNLRQLWGDNRSFFDSTLVKCYAGHYNDSLVDFEWSKKHMDRISPWYFRPHYGTNFLNRHKYKPTKREAFFRGIFIKNSRNFIRFIEEENHPEMNAKIGFMRPPMYAHELSTCTCAVNAPGIRDMCYRDIDNFLMGIPTIRPNFTSRLLIKIPDEIYIPVEHEVFNCRYRRPLHGMPSNHRQLAKDIIQKWDEVKDDVKFLNTVSQNAMDFANEHFTVEAIAKNSFKLLQDCKLFD